MSTAAIPSTLKKTIQSIKEITGNHSDEDVYAMLKECSMDPNETAQKLLLQDTFHEVKRKRDRRKENLNKEPVEPSWRSGAHGRGNRAGRVNYTARHGSHDAGGGRHSGSGKDSKNNQVLEKAMAPSLPTFQEPKCKEVTAASSVTVMANGPAASGSTGAKHVSSSSAESGINLPVSSMPSQEVNKLESTPAPTVIVIEKTGPAITSGSGDVDGQQPTSTSSNCSVSKTSDSCKPQLPETVGTSKREAGSQQTSVEPNVDFQDPKRPAYANETRGVQGKMRDKSSGYVKNSGSDSSRPRTASSHESSSGSRPSSNYNNRAQVIGAQRVNSNKEWKPKSMNPRVTQGLASGGVSEVPAVSVESSGQSQPESSALDSCEAVSKLQEKLDELHIERKQVILPNHIRVPESERLNLSFGSFGSSFVLPTNDVKVPEGEKTSISQPEASQITEENVEEQSSSNQHALISAPEADYPASAHTATEGSEILAPAEDIVSSSPVPDNSMPKQESEFPSRDLQYSTVHTSNYNSGIMTPNLGGQLVPVEPSDSQERDVSHLPTPNIGVQPPVDPASYYAQFYRSGADGDGRISPFHAPGAAAKYNGNVAVFPLQTSQGQESANSLFMSTAAPTPLATQAVGLTQSSTVAVSQQPLPIFRSPTGMPLSHFPANYIPYGHYYPQFYVAPPGMHHYLNNSPFSPQPQAGSLYPAPSQAAATATGIKYPLPQYKSGTNSGNPTHIGMPNAFGPYGSSPVGYNPSSATAGNSNSDDLGPTQFKDNNVYVTGQQNEGAAAVWVPAPNRDVPNLPAGSYYNIQSPGGQPVTFTPTQASHGSYANLYHPAQPVTAGALHPLVQQPQNIPGNVDMVGPAGNIYQQHSQNNWSGNF